MSFLYLLDTAICIYIAKQKPSNVFRKFEQLSVGDVGMSTITYGELSYGVQKSQNSNKNFQLLENLTSIIPPIPMSIEAGSFYGELRGQLEKQGKLIGNNDLWIAAHALALDLILVTNNTKEFARVPGLKMENWI